MSFSIKARCKDGELLYRRKTPEAALKKAREMSRTGCYEIYITTPEGRDYHSSEFADLPRTPVARPSEKTQQPTGPVRFRVILDKIFFASWMRFGRALEAQTLLSASVNRAANWTMSRSVMTVSARSVASALPAGPASPFSVPCACKDWFLRYSSRPDHPPRRAPLLFSQAKFPAD